MVEAGESQRELVTSGPCSGTTSFRPRSEASMLALFAVVLVTIAVGQSSHSQQGAPAGAPRPTRAYPAPTNLKVLPKSFTGRLVHDVMEQWSGEIGVRCSACHIRESEGIVSGAPSHAVFADDSRPMKAIARTMYTMTAEINRKFITGDDGEPGPVTCGTCHRGNIRPEPFVIPSDPQRPPERVAISQ